MKKKVYSIVLCLGLVLTLIPASIFAADDSTLPEGLYWCWAKEVSDDPFVLEYDSTEELRTSIPGAYPGGQGVVFIYLDANHERHQLKKTDLTTTGDFFTLNEETNDCFDVHYSNVGTGGKVYYKGTTFSVDVDADFLAPDFAFYVGPTACAQDYRREFDYTGTNGTLYFIASNACTITNLTVSGGVNASAVVSSDNTYATITINELNESDELIVSFDGTDGNGSFANRERYLWVNDCQPGLYWRWPADEDWSGDKPVFTPDPDGYLNHDISGTPYGAQYGQFVYRDENGNKEVVNCSDLTSTNDNFFEMNDMGNGFTRVRTYDFGQGKISYNNKDIVIKSVLPTVGFYTNTTVSQETFVNPWVYRGTNKTIYLVPENGVTLSNVNLREQDNCHVSLSFDGSEPYATITMDQIEGDGYIEVSYNWTDGSRTHYEELGIGVAACQPGLYWRWPKSDWSTGELVLIADTDERLQTTIHGYPRYQQCRQFFFRDDSGNLTELHCSDLVKSGDCFEMEDIQDDFVSMRFPKFGAGTLSYQGYSIQVISELPDVGPYTDTPATEGNYLLGDWVYKGDNNTIYQIARDGKTLSNVRNMSDNQVAITLSSDQTCATIELQDLVEPGRFALELRYDVTTPWGDTYSDSMDIAIYDMSPGLVWRQPDLVNGQWVADPDGEIYRDAYNDIMYNIIREFLFRDENGNLTRLSASDLTVSDPFIELTQDDSGMVIVKCTDFGTGTISYGNYSIKITSGLPYVGLYSKPEATEANFLAEWNPAESETAYIVSTDTNLIFTDASENSSNNASFVIGDGGKYVEVHLANNTSDYLEVKTIYHYTNNTTDQEWPVAIDLVLPQNTEPDPGNNGNSGGGNGGSTPGSEDPATDPEEPAEQPVDDLLQEPVTVEVEDPETGEMKEVEVTKAAAEAAEKFEDVEPTAYYAEAVGYAVEKGITAGVAEDKFGPEMDCTRAQVVTFLWAACGQETPEDVAPFSDTADNAYYADAVAWAVENEITSGTSENTFSPDDTVTRAQFITMLWISQGKPEVEATVPFEDMPENEIFAKAIAWAYANNITAGTSATTFGPDAPCTRGQIVTFLHVALDK